MDNELEAKLKDIECRVQKAVSHPETDAIGTAMMALLDALRLAIKQREEYKTAFYGRLPREQHQGMSALNGYKRDDAAILAELEGK